MQSVARTVTAGLKSSALKRIAATLSPWKTNLPRLFLGEIMDAKYDTTFRFEKRKSTIDGAFMYARVAMEAYPNAKVTIEPIDVGFWKFLVRVETMPKVGLSAKE